ncbi:MAG: hypothetical protein FJW22_09985 [Acidimicrobiia bacterium]|nr:hypothetical protein [Acidimicrobiia bacterium]
MMDRPGDDIGVDALCHAIVDRYHASLDQSLSRIAGELGGLAHRTPSPALDSVHRAFLELAAQIRAHLAKEENLIFPAIEALAVAERTGGRHASLPFVTVLHPIRVLEGEHVRIEQAVEQLREVTRRVNEPDTETPGWRACMSNLATFAAELHEHLKTENEILFPRALDLERRVL